MIRWSARRDTEVLQVTSLAQLHECTDDWGVRVMGVLEWVQMCGRFNLGLCVSQVRGTVSQWDGSTLS